MRTITAPGVQITEYDKSSYSRSMTGTGCLVAGFAHKGEPYSINQFTTKSAWLQFYGEPQTEAEKYFYNAAVEVINEGGNLFCSRLPYDNASFQRMVGTEFKIEKYSDNDGELKHVMAKVQDLDESIRDAYVVKSASQNPKTYELSTIDAYRTEELRPARNKFVIVDKTCSTYKQVIDGNRSGLSALEVVGILPVITTAANALYAQNYITANVEDAYRFETIGELATLAVRNAISSDDCNRPLNTTEWYKYYRTVNQRVKLSCEVDGCTALKPSDDENALTTILADLTHYGDNVIISSWLSDYQIEEQRGDSTIVSYTVLSVETADDWTNAGYSADKIHSAFGWHNPYGDDALPNTVSFEANDMFPAIQFEATTDDRKKLSKTHLKKIGVVVYQMYLDSSNNNKIEFEPVEAFAGSLCRTDVDPTTGATVFIDRIINENSQYINFFSNCFSTSSDKIAYDNTDILLAQPASRTKNAVGSSVLGFNSDMTKKTISVSKSVYDGLSKMFNNTKDINEYQIDVVIDAGIANVASFVKAIFGNAGEYDLQATDDAGNSLIKLWKCDSNNAGVKTWKTVEQKFDDFCKNTRKDCMFIADGLRPLVLQGNKKIVRSTAPNNTIDSNILPYVKWLTGLNTSYGAGYIDWFEVADDYSGDTLWLPPSIKAAGIYINTDINFNYWDAPAGLNRGVVSATDVSFSPTVAQAGTIYNKSWNYAINYPQDGIVLEGQKTFQSAATAFDRVNVRRMFLRLERATYQVARQFLYEGNTAYTRQRLIDAIEPYFKAAKSGGGIKEYKIICDETINTPDVIDNNELRVKVGIIPVKTIEFIWVQFYALSTGGSFSEIL